MKLQPEPALAAALCTVQRLRSSAGAVELYTHMRAAAVAQALTAAQALMYVRASGAEAASEQLAAAAQAWASSDVQQLQLAYLAGGAQHMHAAAQSRASLALQGCRPRDRAMRQQLEGLLAVPRLHEQLLDDLGMPLEDGQRQQHLEVEGAALDAIFSWVSAVVDEKGVFQGSAPQRVATEAAANTLKDKQGSSSSSRVVGSGEPSSSSSSSSSNVGTTSGSSSRSPFGAHSPAALLVMIELQLLQADDAAQAARAVKLLLATLMRCRMQFMQQPAVLRRC
uniref:Uncharacterized protein n=1 Tax=Tetradesmus obliquus TaxID=3088 RepID=A0A383WMP0_TETOB|eukprot:jgi/Sobl393_1/11162/SZX78006.1